MTFEKDVVVKQIIEKFMPQKVILFGSHAKGTASTGSDIDLCIIADTQNKRKATAQLYYSIDCEIPIDFILYTPSEWEECIADKNSFAFKVLNEGVVLYG